MKPYYQDEQVTLYHGDCLEIGAWLKADVLVTDPPYGIHHRDKRMTGGASLTQAERTRLSQERIAAGTTYRVSNDEDTSVRDTALELWGMDRPGLVFGHWRRPRPPNICQRLLWCKNTFTGLASGSTHPWITTDEEIYVVGRSMSQFAGARTDVNVYRTLENRSKQAIDLGHPTTKPIALMDQLIRKCPAGMIADPFAGSGSTLISARNLGRKAIGVEIEEQYCDLIVRRLAQGALDFGQDEAS